MRDRSGAARPWLWGGVLTLALAVLLAAVAWLDPLPFPRDPAILALNVLPLWLLFALGLSLWRRVGAALLACLCLLAAFQSINANKLRHLESPLLPSDAGVLPQVIQTPEIYLHYIHGPGWWWLALPLFALSFWREPVFPLRRGGRWLLGTTALGALWLGAVGAAPWVALYDRLAPPFQPWSLLSNAREHGSVAFFMRQLSAGDLSLPAPNTSRLAAFRAHDTDPADPDDREIASPLPDVIVLQSEALFDPGRLRGLDGAVHLPALYALRATHPHGELRVPAYGGLTTRTEFEVLTGIALSAFPGVQYPYQQLVNHALPALPQYLRDRGYQSVAVHPNDARFYRRHKVLPMLGFERFHAGSEFTDAEHHGFYVADSALSRRVMELADADGSQFLLAVSMENHGPWTEDRPLPAQALQAIDVPAELGESEAAALRRYLHHLRRADAELERMAEWVLNRDQPTVLLFYGDHLPGLNTVFEQLGFVDGRHPVEQTVPWLLVCGPGACPQPPISGPLASYELPAMLLGALGWRGDAHFHDLQRLLARPGGDPERDQIALELARERISQRATSVALATPLRADFVEVEAWGPTGLEALDDSGKLSPPWWVKAKAPLPRGVRLRIGGHPLRTQFQSPTVVIGIWPGDDMPDERFAAGSLELELFDIESNRIQRVGAIEVLPRAERIALSWWQRAQDLCPVQAWGPDRTSRGKPVNRQPDGGMGLWIKTACLPRQAEVEIGGRRIAVKTQPGLATVSIPADWLAAGSRMPIALIDVATGERLPVGEVQVEQ